MKKLFKYSLYAAFVFFSCMNVVYAASAKLEFCKDEGIIKTFQIAGYALYLVKIIVPILLIIFAMIDLTRVVIGGNAPDDLKKSLQSLTKRVIAAVVVFMIPALVDFAFTIVDNIDDVKSDFEPCEKCLVDPGSC